MGAFDLLLRAGATWPALLTGSSVQTSSGPRGPRALRRRPPSVSSLAGPGRGCGACSRVQRHLPRAQALICRSVFALNIGPTCTAQSHHLFSKFNQVKDDFPLGVVT